MLKYLQITPSIFIFGMSKYKLSREELSIYVLSHPVPIMNTCFVTVCVVVIEHPGSRYSVSPSCTSSLAIAALISTKWAFLVASLFTRHELAWTVLALATSMVVARATMITFLIFIVLYVLNIYAKLRKKDWKSSPRVEKKGDNRLHFTCLGDKTSLSHCQNHDNRLTAATS